MTVHRILSVITAVVLAVTTAAARAYSPDEVPNVQLADSTRLVSNPDGILSPQAEAEINRLLLDIRRKTTAEVTMVVIDDMAPGYDIDSYATELFDLWKPGKKDRDNGAIILVAKDAHKYVIRTGYGVEGILPDVVCARIGRNVLVPAFRQNDFDGGLTEAARRIHETMTDPDVRGELVSRPSGDATDTLMGILAFYIGISVLITCIMGVYILLEVNNSKGKERRERYMALRSMVPISKWSSLFLLGLPLLIYFPLRKFLRNLRDGEHKCPNCGTPMHKLPEDEDNNYLTPAQDTEERIDSVDYDVWLCPNCGEKDIIPYPIANTVYTVCPNCQARAAVHSRDRILLLPTTQRIGHGVHEYTCLNCHHVSQVPYKIARTVAPIFIGGGGSGIGGGGFGGGSFGGGMTGGGGASGGW